MLQIAEELDSSVQDLLSSQQQIGLIFNPQDLNIQLTIGKVDTVEKTKRQIRREFVSKELDEMLISTISRRRTNNPLSQADSLDAKIQNRTSEEFEHQKPSREKDN